MAAQHHLPVLLLLCLSQVQGQGCGEGSQCLHYSQCQMSGRVEEEKLQAGAAQAVEDIVVAERKAYNGNLSEFRDQYFVGILALQGNQSTLRKLRNQMLENLKMCARGGLPRGQDSDEWRCCQEQANLSSRMNNINSEGQI